MPGREPPAVTRAKLGRHVRAIELRPPAQLVLLLRRAGRLIDKDRAGKPGEAPRFFRNAERAASAVLDAGYRPPPLSPSPGTRGV